MFKKMRNQVLSSIVVLAMLFSLMPAIQVETQAATNVSVDITISGTDATLAWDAYKDAEDYYVYKSPSRFGEYTKIATQPETSYTDHTFDGDYYKVSAVVGGKETALSDPISFEIKTFGENTYIFEETDDMNSIQNVIDTAFKTTEAGQFGKDRYAFMFMPSGKQYDVVTKVGFYTQVAGLGLVPDDVNVKRIQCLAEWMKGKKYDGNVNYNALCNFWRSVENVSSNAEVSTWAVSQATAMRRVHFTGGMNLHQEGGYASGGFLADSKIGTFVSCGSQQQWLSRNVVTNANNDSRFEKWNYQAAVWNDVLVGSQTSIKESNWDKTGKERGTSTVVEKTPKIAEKPYLSYIDKEYKIVVPKVKEDRSGVSWDDFKEGSDYSLINPSDYYVAKPGQTADEINAAIVGKKALILSPGIYELDKSININDNDFVVLGMGYATIKPTSGNECMKVANVTGVRLAGILFDAGRQKSEDLLRVGETKDDKDNSANPTIISDCFFRVGGADSANCQVENCVEVNTNDVICDNFWVWRADHGSGVGWYKNTADNGVTFNGDNITAYGLMVEHFQKQQTIWNGNGGRTYMYQSELPYDIPSQSAWNEPGSYGYTDYVVSKDVNSHEGYGIGIYSCYQAAQCYLKSALTCPDTPDVKFTNVCTYSLVGNGGIDRVINNAGYAILGNGDMSKVFSYCNGVSKSDKEGETARKNIMTCTYDPEIEDRTYTGKEIKPIGALKCSGVALRYGVDYVIDYYNNTNIGTARVVIKGLGNFKDSDTLYFKIIPGKVKFKKVKASKKKIKIKYGKVLGAGGYEVQWAKKSSFKGKKVKKIKKTSYTIKRKDKKRKKYYVRVRAYKKVNGKYYYGKFSKKKKVK